LLVEGENGEIDFVWAVKHGVSFANYIILYRNEDFLDLWKTIVPGFTSEILAFEIADCFEISVVGTFIGPGWRLIPFNLVADFVIEVSYCACSKTDSTGNFYPALGTFEIALQVI